MKNIKDMDYEESNFYIDKLESVHQTLESTKDDFTHIMSDEEFEKENIEEHIDQLKRLIEYKIEEAKEQQRLNQEASDMAHDTLSDLDNSQK